MNPVLPFLFVGGSAAAVHQCVVMIVVEGFGFDPAWANLPGFLCAWCVSYLGHRRLTFRTGVAHRQAAPRFLLVSVTAFAANHLLFVGLLTLTDWHYAVALFLTQLTVAVGTYLASRLWAFAPPGPEAAARGQGHE